MLLRLPGIPWGTAELLGSQYGPAGGQAAALVHAMPLGITHGAQQAAAAAVATAPPLTRPAEQVMMQVDRRLLHLCAHLLLRAAPVWQMPCMLVCAAPTQCSDIHTHT